MSAFMDKPSAAYTEAVRALRALITQDDGTDAASRAYAEAVSAYWKIMYASRTGKESDVNHECIHRVLGQRCPTSLRNAFVNKAECESDHIPRADHLSEWKAKDGSRRVVSQPYGLDYASLKAMVAFCERLGLEVSIDVSLSWHFPGRTLLVEYKQAPQRTAPPAAAEILDLTYQTLRGR